MWQYKLSDVFRVISHQSHVPAFKFRKNEIIVKGHEAPVILHVLQVKIQFQSAVQARESIGVLLWAVLIILPILSHCRFTCHLKIGLFPFQSVFYFHVYFIDERMDNSFKWFYNVHDMVSV